MDSRSLQNLLSTRDAAELSGYNPDYIGKLCRTGVLPGTRVGRSWFVEETTFKKFVAKQKAENDKRAEELAKERVKEYRQHQKVIEKANKTLVKSEETTESPVPVSTPAPAVPVEIQREEKSVPSPYHSFDSFFAKGVAVSMTLLALSSGLALGYSGASSKTLALAVEDIQEANRLTASIFSTDAVNTVRVAHAQLGEVLFESLQSGLETYTNALFVSGAALRTAVDFSEVRTLATSLEQQFSRVYEPALVAYLIALEDVGSETLEAGALVRDTLQKDYALDELPSITDAQIAFGNALITTANSFITSHEVAVDGWVAVSGEVPSRVVATVYGIGDALNDVTLRAPTTIATSYTQATYALGAPTADVTLAVLNTGTEVRNTLARLLDTGESNTLAAAVEGDPFNPASSIYKGGRSTALYTYTTINNFFRKTGSSIASLFAPQEIAVDTIPSIPVPTTTPDTAPTVSRPSHSIASGTTVLQNITNQFITSGVTFAYLEQRLRETRSSILDRRSVTRTTTGSGTGSVTSVTASGGSTGLSFTGGPITSSGTLTLGGTLAVGSGGTGIGTAPAYGEVLLGDGSGGYVLTATSSLGITGGGGGGGVTSLAQTYGSSQTGGITFATSSATTFNGLTIANSITNSGTTFTFAPNSITGTLDNAGLSNSTISYGGVTLSLGGSDATPSFDLSDASGLPIVGGTTGTLSVSRGGTGSTTLTGLLKGNGTGSLLTAVPGTDYENPLSFTYPLSRSANTISLAFGTTTSNTWAGTQTFTNTPIVGALSGLIGSNNGSLYQIATSTNFVTSITAGSGISVSGNTGAITISATGGGGTGNVATSSTESAGYIPFWTSTAGTPATLGADSNFFWDNSNKRLGIGTTTPARGIHLVDAGSDASIRVDRLDNTNGPFNILSRWNGAGTAVEQSWAFGFPDGSTFVISDLGTSVAGTGTARIAIPSATGNVGIGTTSPYAKLSVVGQTVSEYFTATSTSATSTFPNTSITNLSIGGDYLTDLVGTGLQVISGALSLNATGDWTGTFDGQEGTYYLSRANHTGTQLASTISDFNSAVGSYISGSSTIPHIGGSAYGDILSWTGSAWETRATSSLNVALTDTTGTLGQTRGGTGFTSYTAGDIIYADLSGNLQKLGIGSAGQVLKVTGGLPSWGADLTTGGGGGATAWATTSDSLAIYPSDTSDVLIIGNSATTTANSILEIFGRSYFSDRLGIGTTSPGALLSVAGNTIIDGLATIFGGVTAPSFIATSTTATTTLAGGLTVDTNTLVVDYSTNRVGIGTASPAARLDVTGTARIIAGAQVAPSSGKGLELFYTTDGSETGVVLSYDRGGSAYRPLTLDGSIFRFLVSGTERARFDTTGFFGIGTTTPATNLAVQGSALFSGNISSVANVTATGTVTTVNLSATSATTTNFGINSETFTDLTGTGLSNVGGALTLTTSGDWTGTFDGQEGTYYLSRANHTGTQLASTISDFNSAVQSFIHASTTIPKTYTTNTFTGSNVFNGGLTLSTLNGPLQANNGVVSATTSIGVLYGGTGLTTAPSYGQLLLGNSSGGYTLTATSSLGLGTITAIGPTGQQVSSGAVTIATSTNTNNGITSRITITGSGDTLTFSPSQTGVLAAAGGGTGQSSYTAGDLLYATGATALSKLGIGTGGYVLGVVDGAPAWVATSSINNGVSSVQQTYGSAQTGAITFATSTATTFNGLTISNSITNSGGTFTFAPNSITGTLDNSGLTNSSVSYGGVALSLGGTDATPAFNLVDATGLPISTGVSGLGANVATFLVTPSSANLAAALTDESGAAGVFPRFSLSGQAYGDVTIWNGTSWVNVATSTLGLPTSAITAIGPTGQTQTGSTITFATSTSAANGVTSALTIVGSGNTLTFTPSVSGTLDNSGLTNSSVSYGGVALSLGGSDATPAFNLVDATGLPISTGVSGLGTGVATALGTNVGTAGAFVVNGGALGTPSSGTLTNATGLPIVGGTTGTLTVARGGTGTTTLPVGQVLYGGSGSVYQSVATTSVTLGTGLSYSGTLGAFVGGAAGTLSIATSSLYTGTTGQVPYFSGTNTLIGTSTIFVTAAQDVGIGTNGPANYGAGYTTLAVNDSTTGVIDWLSGGFRYGTAYNASGNFLIGNYEAGDLQLLTDNTARVHIKASTGNVGIGTSSPYAKLSVVGQTVASHFTATTTSTNTFPNTSITKLVNLTSNGLVTTGSSDGTLLVTVPGTGVLTALGVNVGSAGAFVVNGGALGTPSSGTLTNATGLPIGTGVSGLGTNVATFLGTPSSANLAAALTDESGAAGVFPRFSLSGQAYGDVTIWNGTNWVNTATSSLGITASLTGTQGQTAYFSGTNTAVGTSTIFIGTNEYVGIGTSTPQDKLTVWNGNVAVAYGYGLKIAAGNNVTYTNLLTTGYNGSEDFVSLYSAGNASGNSSAKLTLLSGGNVGVGTTTPHSKLHVATSGDVFAQFTNDTTGHASSDGLIVGHYSGSAQAYVVNKEASTLVFGTSNTGRALFDSAGNFGVGDLSPAALFTVGNGDLFQVNSSGAIAAATGITSSGTILFSGTVDIGTNLGGQRLDVYRASNATSGTEYNAIIRQDTTNSSASTLINVALRVDAQHNPSATAGIGGLTGLYSIITNGDTTTVTDSKGIDVQFGTNSGTVTNTYGVYVGDITNGTQTNTPFSFYASDASAYNYFAGRVGIGTAAPDDALEIEGTFNGFGLHIDSTNGAGVEVDRAANSNYYGLYLSTNDTIEWHIGDDGSSTGHFRIMDGVAGTDVVIIEDGSSANSLYIDSGGFVGIGLANPSVRFDVRAGTTNANILQVSATDGGNLAAIFSDGSENSWLRLYDTSGNEDVRINTAGSSYFDGGNIGIGTTSPYRKLSITDAVATAQVAVSYDTTRFTQLLTDSNGDFSIDAQGTDIFGYDENLWICSGGSCPSGSLVGTGNIVAETAIGIASSTPWSGLAIASGKAITVAENTLATSTSISVDWKNGNQQLVRLGTAGTTISFSGYIEGQKLVLTVCNPGATAGAISWGTQILWAGGTAPTQTTTANKCDVWSFLATNATSSLKIFGTQSANF